MKPRCYFIAISWIEGAVSDQFRALSNELVKRGHRVVILITGQKQWAEDHESNPAIYAWPSSRPTNFRDALFLYRLIRKYRPDCLISNFGADNVMLVVGRLMGVPRRINWYHTLSAQIDIDAGFPRWKMNLLRLRKRMVYALATDMVPVSNAASEDVQRVFGVPERKCHLFYNSLADPLAGQALPQAQGETLICIGRLYPSKGQDVVIKAVALLKQTLPDFRVEFVGDGPSTGSFKQLARDQGVEDRCVFQGSVQHDEVLTRMSSSIATLVPSRSDNCPLVTIESLAVGTPVIASGVGGIVEIIRDGMDGFLVPPDNPIALAEKLRLLLSNPELRGTMSRNARERFLTTFEQSRVIREQADWFETIS